MQATWNAIKRNRGKVGAVGTAAFILVGSAYAAKKISESEASADFWQKMFGEKSAPRSSDGSTNTEEENILELRRRYVFDVHQQICDDSLAELLPDLEKIVLAKFDCKEILHRLKDNNEKMTTKEKVTLWQTMKVASICQIMAGSLCCSVAVVAFKLQKAILSREFLRNADGKRSKDEKSASTTSTGIVNYLSSFFFVPQDRPSTTRTDSVSASNADVLKVFSNCTNYLMEQGLPDLCDRIRAVVSNVVDGIALTQPFDRDDLRKLLERIVEELDFEGKGFGSFVIPTRRPVISSLTAQSLHLQQLLTDFIRCLESRQCKELLSSFIQIYLDDVFESPNLIDDGIRLVMAKLIPLLVDNVSPTLFSNEKKSAAFRKLINHKELYQLCSIAFSTDFGDILEA